MKKVLKILFSIMLIALTSCEKTSSKTTQPTTDYPRTTITTPQDDKTITEEKDETANGDIVLYNSNQICLYYDNNSWSFTKLGQINLSKSE